MALFLLLIFTLSSFGTYMMLVLVPKLTGVPIADIAALGSDSSTKTIHASLLAQAISHSSIFTIPALLFAGFTHPRLRDYLGLRMPGKPIHWLLSVSIMLGLIPIFLNGEAWMTQHLHFGKWADDMQAANNTTVAAFLKLKGTGELVLLLFVLAVLPAFGEELVFRGVMLRLFHRRTFISQNPQIITVAEAQKRMIFPIAFTAFLFAAIHFNPYGFVFIFIAGCMLAFIYYLTGSILCSMLAHFVYNGIQVVSVVTSSQTDVATKVVQGDSLPIYFPILGLCVFALSFYLLICTQTPLKANWSDDFLLEKASKES
ncbi:MAG: CPBP family intramembrane glutamic endopeptidase [Chitinophagaceae bacterium]